MSSVVRGEAKIKNVDETKFLATAKDWAEKNGFNAREIENGVEIKGSGPYDWVRFNWNSDFDVQYDSDFRKAEKVISGVQGKYQINLAKDIAKKHGFNQITEEQETEDEFSLTMIGF